MNSIDLYEKITCEFAEAVFQKAMSKKYGIQFCCEKDLLHFSLQKKLLDAGRLQDKNIDLCEVDEGILSNYRRLTPSEMYMNDVLNMIQQVNDNIPVNVSELNNDAGYLQSEELDNE